MSERTLKWHGIVKGGKLKIFAKDAFVRYIKTSLDGKEIELVVQPREKETTGAQYRYLFGHLLPLLADFMGDSIQAAAFIIKDRWHSEKRQVTDPETGESHYVVIPLSFSRGNISRKKFAKVIDNVEMLLDQLGVVHSNLESWQQEAPEITEE